MRAKRSSREHGRIARSLVVVVVLLSMGLATSATVVAGRRASAAVPQIAVLSASSTKPDINKIKHVVFVVQENRSFDEYFGMYPGADGIPVDANGTPTVCLPDPAKGGCDRPFHDPSDVNSGGPHGVDAGIADVNGGAMDGFVAQYEAACKDQHGTSCGGSGAPVPDVMGYKLRADIPNYWAYADNYVLQDHMFEPLGTWSLPAHLAMVSGWSALCYTAGDPLSCRNERDNTALSPSGGPADYAWTDITYLLDHAGVSWAYYVFKGKEPDCQNPDALNCIPAPQSAKTPSIWNPMPGFDTVKSDGTLANIQSTSNLVGAARAGTLPAVSWVIPNHSVSEHPPTSVAAGQTYVTYLINQIMQGPDWDSTAIFLTWDDWGGFYDHATPPQVDANGYGIRTPGLLISPYAKHGTIDHQTLSTDAYLRFIEDRFLGRARIDPATDGRPDNRPDVRENAPQLGNLESEFDFTQAPSPPVILPTVSASQLATPLNVQSVNEAKATANPLASPVVGSAPFTVSFDGSQSSDPGGSIASWKLDFGDGSLPAKGTGTPPAAQTHTYASTGSFRAQLTVKTASGKKSTAALMVFVVDPAPARPTWITGTPINGFAPQAVTFDASLSAPGAWSIDFGDGSLPAVGTGTPPANLVHTYTDPGSYTATLTVDADGVVTKASARSSIIAPSLPYARTRAPARFASTTATLEAHILPNASTAQYWFEWGTTPSLGNVTPTVTLDHVATVDQNLTGLTPGTQYFYRIDVLNSLGPASGSVLDFTTKP
jgi:phospholipase C